MYMAFRSTMVILRLIVLMYPITDGYELPNHGRQSIYPNGSLVIENAHKLHDEGFYTCTAFNSNDETHSGTLQIEVLSK